MDMQLFRKEDGRMFNNSMQENLMKNGITFNNLFMR